MNPTLFAADPVILVFVVNVVLQVTLVLILATVVARLIARRPVWRHGVCLQGLLCALLCPLVVLLAQWRGVQWGAGAVLDWQVPADPLADSQPQPLPIEPASLSAGAASRSLSSLLAPPPADWPAEEGSLGRPESSAQHRWAAPFLSVLALLYAVGCGWLLLRLVLGLVQTSLLRRSLRPVPAARILGLRCDLQRTLGCDRLPEVLVSEKVEQPFTLGIHRPVVVLPAALLQELTQSALREILVHEMAHALRRDGVVGVLQRLLAALFWPHPLVHHLNATLARAREELCDNYVLQTASKVHYCETLLELAQRQPLDRGCAATLALIPRRWRLEERVAGLLDERRSVVTRLGLPFTVSLSMLGLLLSLVLAAAPALALPGGEEPLAPIDLAGVWNGGEWGTVRIVATQGSYTRTHAAALGQMVFARTGRRSFSGFWKESDRQGGSFEFQVGEDGQRLEGRFQVSLDAQFQPGHRSSFHWIRIDDCAAGEAPPTATEPEHTLGTESLPSHATLFTGIDPRTGNLWDASATEPWNRETLQQRLAAVAEQDRAANFKRLGEELLNRGLFEEARETLRQCIEVAREEGQNSVLHSAQMLLARALLTLGDHERGEVLLRAALDEQQRLRPESHEVARIFVELSRVLRSRGESQESCELLRRAVEMLQQQLGSDHPETSGAMLNLGQALVHLGRMHEAVEILTHTYESQQRVLGTQHPLTIESGVSLADCMIRLGDLDAAVELLRWVQKAQSSILGEDHASTQRTRALLRELGGKGSKKENRGV